MANRKKGAVKRKRKLFVFISTESHTRKVRSFTKEKSKTSDFANVKMYDPVVRKHVFFRAARLEK
ncbi:MAG: 50S ribosomal protein L33 [Pseudomonadota bacterium]